MSKSRQESLVIWGIILSAEDMKKKQMEAKQEELRAAGARIADELFAASLDHAKRECSVRVTLCEENLRKIEDNLKTNGFQYRTTRAGYNTYNVKVMWE